MPKTSARGLAIEAAPPVAVGAAAVVVPEPVGDPEGWTVRVLEESSPEGVGANGMVLVAEVTMLLDGVE